MGLMKLNGETDGPVTYHTEYMIYPGGDYMQNSNKKKIAPHQTDVIFSS